LIVVTALISCGLAAIKANCIGLPISTKTEQEEENSYESSMHLTEKNAKDILLSVFSHSLMQTMMIFDAFVVIYSCSVSCNYCYCYCYTD